MNVQHGKSWDDFKILVAVKALSDVFMSAYQGSDRNRLEFMWGRRASWDQAREEFPKKTKHDPSVEQLF